MGARHTPSGPAVARSVVYPASSRRTTAASIAWSPPSNARTGAPSEPVIVNATSVCCSNGRTCFTGRSVYPARVVTRPIVAVSGSAPAAAAGRGDGTVSTRGGGPAELPTTHPPANTSTTAAASPVSRPRALRVLISPVTPVQRASGDRGRGRPDRATPGRAWPVTVRAHG